MIMRSICATSPRASIFNILRGSYCFSLSSVPDRKEEHNSRDKHNYRNQAYHTGWGVERAITLVEGMRKEKARCGCEALRKTKKTMVYPITWIFCVRLCYIQTVVMTWRWSYKYIFVCFPYCMGTQYFVVIRTKYA